MMNNLPAKTNHNMTKAGEGETSNPTSQVGMIAKGVATGVAVSTIVHSGRSLIGTMSRNPLIMFGLGVAVGFFAHKYRKEIVSVSRKAVEESRDFVLRQKEHLEDLIAESQEEVDIPKNLH